MRSALTKSKSRLQRPWHPAIVDYTRMLVVGSVGFVTDFGLFNGLLQLGAAPNLANLVAICVSSALVFGVNLRWTYRHREVPLPHHSALKFAGIQIGSLTLIALGMALVTAWSSSVLVWNLAKFLLTIGIGFGRFYLYREWVYTHHGEVPDQSPGGLGGGGADRAARSRPRESDR